MRDDLKTKKQLVEELRSLRESEHQFHALFENAPIGIGIVDAAGKLLAFNDAMLEPGKYNREEIERIANVGALYYNLENRKEVLELFNRQGVLKRYPLQFKRKDGSPYDALLSLTRTTFNGQACVHAIVEDVTDRKIAEEALRESEEKYRQLQKSESLGRMAGAIAHQFNNHLQAVMMNLELAMNNLAPHQEPAENLKEALQSVRKAAEVSRLMLTYLGQTNAKREPLDLSDVCRRSLSRLRPVLPESMILETEFPAPGPGIRANVELIQQILNNLVINAWEAGSDKGGAIRLAVRTVASVDIPAKNRFPIDFLPKDDAYACMEVRDKGCGILGKDIEKLFDPFFSTKFTGRGLGLPVVLGIVRAHHGAIAVESKPGRGSSFRIYLPVSPEVIPRQPIQEVPSPETTDGGMVLVAEDDPSLRKTTAAVLTHLGFTVMVAKDGVETMEIFRQHRNEIRCVLCDLTMPRMNGWETLTSLRKLDPHIPVILAGDYGEAQAMAGHHSELPQAFLSKPYERKAIIDAIHQVLANRND